jgi:hypothetical protein
MQQKVLSGIRPSFPGLSQSQGQVTHVLLTRSPLEYPPKGAFPLDLHVLSTPPAFVLSQDQTLQQGTTTTPESKSRNRQTSEKNPGKHKPHHCGLCIASKKSPPQPTRSHGTGPDPTPPGPDPILKALAFNTLLSSQETDTHRARTRSHEPNPGATTPGYPNRLICQSSSDSETLAASAARSVSMPSISGGFPQVGRLTASRSPWGM